MGITAAAAELPDFDKLWNYNKPAETEAVFRGLVPAAKASGNLDYYLQLLTQVARTQSLQRKFDEAHAILDEVKPQLNETTKKAEVRYHLERGRSFRSSGKADQALPHFNKAFDVAEQAKLESLAVDAVHMIALVEQDPEKQLEWNFKAVTMAKRSVEPRARGWLASLYNNIGWTYHDTNRFEDALKYFESALELRVEAGEVSNIRMAKWCVARALRSLRNNERAMKIQLALVTETEAAGEPDGYVYEELAHLFELKGDLSSARSHATKAYALLLEKKALEVSDPRMIHLKRLAET
jgi:tetratricopeptide (TPR) repeat protein